MTHLIAPSVLSADFGNLQNDIELINRSNADWFHVDVMDGLFVPNISFGFPVIKVLKKWATKPLDVHLMIEKPERYIQDFKDVGANILTVHIEASIHLHRTLQSIRDSGMKAGIALNPHTPVSALDDILENADLICLMSVNPGFGGQKFISSTYKKVETLSNTIAKRGLNTLIEIDGGVTHSNASQLLSLGANVLVAGNTVFGDPDPLKSIDILKNIVK